ncbi:antifungal protein ginkbilobin-like protein [Dendrobium catenatum]|uniref:Antifungal protein ginkbilobin-2 n=1 Tax=Dendrobium catenatum TaxID=906689 RepID=A0A2I0WXZ7_9ASPA|nr:antifungal protein ginkbilobin-like protein [Dendrobium catenatum]PKU80538.1 Antifungal protein ginkbilobin-2 [Dendrobium catenatum]
MPKPRFLAALLLLLISSTPFPAACASSSVCNLEKFIAYGIFAINLDHLFNDLVEFGSVKPGENYYHMIFDDVLGFPAYGRCSCSGSLTAHDCRSCLEWAVDLVTIWCKLAIGGQVELGDCGLRYEQYKFV